jgi:hypothetical protein
LKLADSATKIMRCLHPEPRFNGTIGGDQGYEMWLLFEQVPQKLYLPAFQQKHELTFSLGNVSACECKCPYFTSTRLPCCAMCALLARKGFTTTDQMIPFLKSMWLVKNHPLYGIATRPAAAESTVPLQASEQAEQASDILTRRSIVDEDVTTTQGVPSANLHTIAIQRHNADALRNLTIPTDTNGRRTFLNTLFQQILPGAAASAVVTREVIECFIVQRAKLGNSQSLIAAPNVAISRRQELAGLGPVAEVPNLAAPKVYNPAKRHRVNTARKADPSCYNLHKKAGLNQPVECMCGETYINNHKVSFHLFFILACFNSNLLQVSFAHRKTKEHQAWLKSYTAPPASIPVIAASSAPAEAAPAPIPDATNCLQSTAEDSQAFTATQVVQDSTPADESQEQVYRHQRYHIQPSFTATQVDGAADENGWLPGLHDFNAATRVASAAPTVAAAALVVPNSEGASGKKVLAKSPRASLCVVLTGTRPHFVNSILKIKTPFRHFSGTWRRFRIDIRQRRCCEHRCCSWWQGGRSNIGPDYASGHRTRTRTQKTGGR